MGSTKAGRETKPNRKSKKRKKMPAKSLMLVGIVAAVVCGVFLLNRYDNQTDRSPALKDAKPSRPSVINESPAQNTFIKLLGRWQRPDGGYVIDISSINADGSLEAAYFNPRPINVSQASAATKEGRINIFIELRDVGYPGARYSLIYNPQSDTLKGLYYQPSVEQSFEVVFARMNP